MELVERNVRFAQDVAGWMNDDERGGRWYEVLDLTHEGKDGQNTIHSDQCRLISRPNRGGTFGLSPSVAWTYAAMQSDQHD